MPSLFSGLREETVHGIWAVLFFVLAVFFGLSAFNVAGVAGEWIFKFFNGLFGVGYYLIPILFLMLSITYTGSLREHLGGLRAFGATLFFVSALSLIDLVFEKGGGLIGSKISAPLVSLFDKATIVILIALVLISVLILFDLRFSFAPLRKIGNIFKKKEKGEEDFDDYEDEELYDDYDEVEEEIEDEEGDEEEGEEYEDEEEGDEETEPEEPKKKKGLNINLFGKKKGDDENGGFRLLPTADKYTPPPLNLLEKDKGKPNVGDIKANANLIKRTFSNFGIEVEMDEVSIGPTVTRYALKPAEGVRLQRILGLQNNLELALAAHPVRIEAPIPGRALVGIEVPNTAIATIGMLGIIGDKRFKNTENPLTVGLGKDIEGKVHFSDLSKMPHCLIAGTTGSGKSVMIHSLITSLLYNNGPQQLKFIMIDPKRVELTLYKDIPHLLTPVLTQGKKAILALKWAAKEMERRYEVLESETVRDISSYHMNVLAPAVEDLDGSEDEEERANLPESMPYIVIVIDELADIMGEYPKELEASIVRLAAKSRAVGIHLVLSTQRPSVNVVTGLIKANIPTRMALQVPSLIDSRTIIDGPGAEKLLGKGDMLYLASDSPKPIRVQSPFISENEVKKIVKYLKKKHADDVPSMIDFSSGQVENGAGDVFASVSLEDDEDSDPLYEQARMEVIQVGKASTSYLQRKLRVGYSRAARLMDLLEERGVIGPADGSKPREIIGDGSGGLGEPDDVLNPLSDDADDDSVDEVEEDEELDEAEYEDEEDSEEEEEGDEEEYEDEEEEEDDGEEYEEDDGEEEDDEDEDGDDEDGDDLYSKR